MTVIFSDGRYMVSWPWRESNPDLPENYQLTVGRLKSTVMKLVKTPELFKQYDEIIQDQLKRGIIEKVTSTSPEGLIKSSWGVSRITRESNDVILFIA